MKEKLKKTLKAKFNGQYVESDNKIRSLIILIICFSVIIALTVVIKVNYKQLNEYNNKNNNNNNTQTEGLEDEEFLSLDRIFINYLDNYKYYISVDDNNIIIKYEGSITNGNNTGKRIINKDEINYSITDDNIIDSKTNREITNLYKNYLSYFFNPTNVYEFIKDLESTDEVVDNKKIYSFNGTYEEIEIKFNITTTKDRIEEILYEYNNIKYSITLE